MLSAARAIPAHKPFWKKRLRGEDAGYLLHGRAILLVQHQTVENGQNLLAVGVDTLQIIAEGCFKIGGLQPFVKGRAGYVDILSQGFHVVTAQKKPIKESRLPLRS